LTGFEVAGADGKFVPATARIDGHTVIASSPAVPEPRFVRYGWANSPQCNLFNGEDLPASPFNSAE
jgi:sialate O-acetylesterase